MNGVDAGITTAASLLHRVRDVMSGDLDPGFHNFNRLKWNRYWKTVNDWSTLQGSCERDQGNSSGENDI